MLHFRSAQRDRDRYPEPFPEQCCRVAVGISEMSIENVQPLRAAQSNQRGARTEGHQHAVELLQDSRDREESGTEAVDAILDLVALHRRPEVRTPPAQQRLEGKPWRGRHHGQRQPLRHAKHPLAHEDARGGLRRAGPQRAEHDYVGRVRHRQFASVRKAVHVSIVLHAGVPVPLLLDKARPWSSSWGQRAVRQQPHNGFGQRCHVAGAEQHHRRRNQLLVAADIRGYQQPLRHRLRGSRSHQLRQGHRSPGIREHVDNAVVALNLIVRHAAGTTLP
jgi:hypothetical protein